jgi:hypothetical protein
LRKLSVSRKFSRKFPILECRSGSRRHLNVYPDPKQNHLKTETETFRENHPGTQIFQEKTFAKTFAKAKIFTKQNFATSERIFASFRFSRK